MKNIGIGFLVLFLLYGCSQNSPKPTVESNIILHKSFSDKELKLRLDSLYRNDMFKEALVIIDSLIVIDSLNGELYYRKGICLDKNVSRDSAIVCFIKSAQLGYRLADCYFLIGTSYYLDKKDSLSILYIKKALEINPKDEEAQKILLELQNREKRSPDEHSKHFFKAI